MKKIKKVVIPIAGMGTRFLPITKTISKTLLPIIDKPVIQYLLEEAVAADIEEALLIIGYNQNDVIDYFDTESEYVKNLKKEYEEIEEIRRLKSKIKISFVVQEKARGLGDAVLHAKEFANGEDFALILGDDFVLDTGNKSYGIGTLCKYYEEKNAYYLGVQKVAIEDANKYGIVKPLNEISNNFLISDIVEKPNDNPPSNVACVGRYILKNSIFSYLENIGVGYGGEVQLTDGLAKAVKNERIFATIFNGRRYDVGNKKEYINAILAVAKTKNNL